MKYGYISLEAYMICLFLRIKNVTLSADMKDKVPAIGAITDTAEQEEEADKLMSTVPGEFTSVPFGIGGWFRATTTCTSSTEFTVEETHVEAAKRNENTFSAHCAPGVTTLVGSMTAGVGFARDKQEGSSTGIYETSSNVVAVARNARIFIN